MIPTPAKRHRKPKTDKQKMIERLDDLFSEYVRRRAIRRVHGCERCGTWKADWRRLQCAHLRSRKKHSTRWHEWNGVGLCGGCHRHIDSDAEAKVKLALEILGEERYERLYLESQIPSHYKPQDYTLVEIYLKQLLKEAEWH